jgi:hypothetical protein
MIIKIEMFPEEVLLQMIKKKKNDGWQLIWWKSGCKNLGKPPWSFTLFMDAYLKIILGRDNCDLIVIPGGMTSQLQPLDVS